MPEALRRLLIRLRTRAGIEPEDLAVMLGVSRKTLWNWESGARSPGVDDLARWLDFIEATDAERLLALQLAASRPADVDTADDHLFAAASK